MTNPILAENTNIGTRAWRPGSNLATTQFQAYCDHHSVDPDDGINFYMSTQSAGTTKKLASE